MWSLDMFFMFASLHVHLEASFPFYICFYLCVNINSCHGDHTGITGKEKRTLKLVHASFTSVLHILQ